MNNNNFKKEEKCYFLSLQGYILKYINFIEKSR